MKNVLALTFIFAWLTIAYFSFDTVAAQTTPDFFSIRSADFMPLGATIPDMDDPIYTRRYEETLNNLSAASPNGEITHVQLRLYWTIDRTSYATQSNPYLGSPDTGQQELMDNWRSWYFCNPIPSSGKCVIQRIKERGFKLEIGISVSWNPSLPSTNVPSPFCRYCNEAAFDGFDGSAFVTNYFNNVIRPVAEQARDSGLLSAGDIFFIGFENYNEASDHPVLHSSEYSNVIAQLRAILPVGVLISDHINGWYEDPGLGHNTTTRGWLNIAYIQSLDLVAPSMWQPWLSTADLPATPEKVRDAHFNNMRFSKIGTGYGGVPAVPGRDFMNDARLIFQKWGTRLIWNSGMRNHYSCITSQNPEGDTCPSGASPSVTGDQEKAAFWAGRLLALKNQTDWVAGQDFERYSEPGNSSTYTSRATASWRDYPAQDAVINGIRDVLQSITPLEYHVNITGIVRNSTSSPIQGASVSCNAFSSSTDSSGRYLIMMDTPAPTSCVLTVTKVGYVTQTIQENFNTNGTYSQDFILQRIPAGVSGRMTDGAGNPLQTNIFIYQLGTTSIANSTSATGDYDLNVYPGTYDVLYNILSIPNFFIKVISFDMQSKLNNLINYVTQAVDKISFTVDISSNQQIQVYSSAKPSRVLVNGTPIPEVASPSQLTNNTWFFNSAESELQILSSLSCSNGMPYGCSYCGCPLGQSCNSTDQQCYTSAAIQIANCDNNSSWSFTSATHSIDTNDRVEGSGSLIVTGTSSGWNAYALYSMPGTWNWSPYQTITFWIKTQDASRVTRFYVYTDWSNFNYYAFNSQLSTNNWIKVSINLNNPTSRTGNINFSSIDFIRFELENARNTIYWLVDDIRIS